MLDPSPNEWRQAVDSRQSLFIIIGILLSLSISMYDWWTNQPTNSGIDGGRYRYQSIELTYIYIDVDK